LSNKVGTLLVGRGWKSQRSFEFSPGERWLIFYDINDPGVELWDLQESTIERYSTELTGHVSGIGTIRFSQNDEWLVTMSSDSTARLWNLAKGLTRTTSTQLKGHRWNVTWAEFTDDDKALITASYSDGTIRFWPLSVTALLDAAERVAGRNLTFNEWQELNSGDIYRPVFADLPVDGSAARSLAHEARKRAEAGDLISAKALFISANDIASKASDPEVSNFVCWWGSLYGFASEVVASGENAVRLAPTSVDYRDTRGVTRALLKDYEGATADFEYVIAGSTPDSLIVRERSGWIRNLRRGQDPFNPNELKQLRLE
jgi:WD40 repeat protein